MVAAHQIEEESEGTAVGMSVLHRLNLETKLEKSLKEWLIQSNSTVMPNQTATGNQDITLTEKVSWSIAQLHKPAHLVNISTQRQRDAASHLAHLTPEGLSLLDNASTIVITYKVKLFFMTALVIIVVLDSDQRLRPTLTFTPVAKKLK